MTTSAYAPLTSAQTVFKDLIWSPMILAGETYIEGVVPFLALPGIKQVDEATINALTDWAFNQLMLVMDVTAIKLVNATHQTAYDNASLQLRVLIEEKGLGSPEYAQAKTAALAALSLFTQFGK
jgi:hypothetical protein